MTFQEQKIKEFEEKFGGFLDFHDEIADKRGIPRPNKPTREFAKSFLLQSLQEQKSELWLEFKEMIVKASERMRKPIGLEQQSLQDDVQNIGYNKAVEDFISLIKQI